jgi:hypothetical protein
VIFANYELPFGRGRTYMNSVPAAVDMILGGWQVNGILSLQTATPIPISKGATTLDAQDPILIVPT